MESKQRENWPGELDFIAFMQEHPGKYDDRTIGFLKDWFRNPRGPIEWLLRVLFGW